jgi:predicted ferric reductase
MLYTTDKLLVLTPLQLLLCLHANLLQETMSFHKLAGLCAAFWALVHGILCTFPLITLSWEWYWAIGWSYKYGVFRWACAGQTALVLQVVMVIFAHRYFRANYYWLFRSAHALYPLVLMAATSHAFECAYYYQLGMILIMADVAARLSVKVHLTTATLSATVSTNSRRAEKTVIIHAQSPFPAGTAPVLNLPGRFFYLQVPDVSVCEWHPLSVSHADAEGNLTFTVKVFGT